MELKLQCNPMQSNSSLKLLISGDLGCCDSAQQYTVSLPCASYHPNNLKLFEEGHIQVQARAGPLYLEKGSTAVEEAVT